MIAREKPEILRACNRCYGRAVAVEDLDPSSGVVISQYGTAHQPMPESPYLPDPTPRTLCGIAAGGDHWWWG